MDPKLNEEEPQRHATNSHLNLNKLELFCFATAAARKPQAFCHHERVWRAEGEYKMQAQTAISIAFFAVNAIERVPSFNSAASLEKPVCFLSKFSFLT